MEEFLESDCVEVTVSGYDECFTSATIYYDGGRYENEIKGMTLTTN